MEEELINATKRNNVSFVLKQIPLVEDINACDSNGNTILHISCQYGYLEIFEAIIKDERVDLLKANHDSQTPLYISCMYNRIQIVQKLLEKLTSQDVNQRCPHATSLYAAAACGYTDIIHLLLLHPKIDPNITHANGETPLGIAVDRGHFLAVQELLLEPKVRLEGPRGTVSPLFKACKGGHVDIARLLLNQNEIEPNRHNIDQLTPLHISIRENRFEILRMLLDSPKVNVNKSTSLAPTPFYFACEEGHHLSVEILLSSPRVDIRKGKRDGYTPMRVACERKHLKVVKILKNHEGINKQKLTGGFSKLYLACWEGNLEEVKEILQTSQKVHLSNIKTSKGKSKKVETKSKIEEKKDKEKEKENVQDKIVTRSSKRKRNEGKKTQKDDTEPPNKKIPLSFDSEEPTVSEPIVSEPQKPLKKVKVEVINVNQCRTNGETPFFVACEMGHLDIVKELLKDPRIKPNFPNLDHVSSPFSIACEKGHLPVVLELLHHPSLNVKNPKESIAAISATCHGGHLEILKILLQNLKLDSDHLMKYPSPLEIACSKGHLSLVQELIRDHQIFKILELFEQDDNDNDDLVLENLDIIDQKYLPELNEILILLEVFFSLPFFFCSKLNSFFSFSFFFLFSFFFSRTYSFFFLDRQQHTPVKVCF